MKTIVIADEENFDIIDNPKLVTFLEQYRKNEEPEMLILPIEKDADWDNIVEYFKNKGLCYGGGEDEITALMETYNISL